MPKAIASEDLLRALTQQVSRQAPQAGGLVCSPGGEVCYNPDDEHRTWLDGQVAKPGVFGNPSASELPSAFKPGDPVTLVLEKCEGSVEEYVLTGCVFAVRFTDSQVGYTVALPLLNPGGLFALVDVPSWMVTPASICTERVRP